MVKIQSQIPILNHFSIPLTIAEEGILEDLLVSHTATILAKMTNTDKKMKSTACWEQSGIRIRIDMEMRIRTPDHICSRFWPWWRFTPSEQSRDCYFGAHNK